MMQDQNIILNDQLITDLNSKINSSIQKRREKRIYGEGYYAQYLTQCDRRIVYRSLGKKSEVDNNNGEIEEISKIFIKKKWCAILNSIYEIEVNADVKVSDPVYNLIGTVDCSVKIDEVVYAVLIDGLQSADFKMLAEKGPTRKDVVTVMANMWMSDVKDGILIYENRDDLSYMLFRVKGSKTVGEGLMKKCQRLSRFTIAGEIPPKSYNEVSDECKICEYRNLCWENN